MVCELMVRHRDVKVSRLLLAELTLHWSVRGFDRLQLVGSDDGFFEASCQGFGQEKRFDLIFAGRVLSDDAALASLVYDRANWTVTIGDTDTV